MRVLSSCLHKHWRLLLGTLVAAGVLVGWQLLPAGSAGMLFWPLWMATAQVVFVGALESAKLRRHAWLGQYIKRESPWRRLLGGGAFMAVRAQLTSILLALVLLVGLRRLNEVDMALLLLATGLFGACQRRLNMQFWPHIIEAYRPALVRRFSMLCIAALLSLGFMLSRLWQPQPYLVDTAWQSVVQAHIPADTGQTLLGSFERLASAFELTGFWLMQNALARFDLNHGVAVLAWAILLLMQATLAWSFARLLAGVAALRHHVSGRGKRDISR